MKHINLISRAVVHSVTFFFLASVTIGIVTFLIGKPVIGYQEMLILALVAGYFLAQSMDFERGLEEEARYRLARDLEGTR
jgi:hypothetical protein